MSIANPSFAPEASYFTQRYMQVVCIHMSYYFTVTYIQLGKSICFSCMSITTTALTLEVLYFAQNCITVACICPRVIKSLWPICSICQRYLFIIYVNVHYTLKLKKCISMHVILCKHSLMKYCQSVGSCPITLFYVNSNLIVYS